MKLRICLLLIIGIAIFTSCGREKENGTFTLQVNGKVGHEDFHLGHAYQKLNGVRYQVDLAKFYLSNLVLLQEGGGEVLVKDLALIDFENTGSLAISSEAPSGKYTGIRFSVGVDSAKNHSDPSIYPQSHPLGLFQSTHWSWQSGYRFILLEGKADSVANTTGAFQDVFLYHTGFDQLYRTITLNNGFTIDEEANYQFDLKLDFNEVFKDIDMAGDDITHAEPATFDLAEQVTNNFASAFSKL